MTERPSILAAGPLTMEEAEALFSTVPPPAREGGPDLYDPRTRTVLRHPAQKLAVQAFARELAQADSDVAGSTPAGGSTGAGVEAGDGERGVGPVMQVRREDRPTTLPDDVEPCSCDEALALRAELEEQTAKVAELEEVLRTEARVRLRLMNEQDGLRQQLAELRRARDTDAVTCREALDRVDELERERDQLRDALRFVHEEHLNAVAKGAVLRDLLREVQYEQSSALIELAPSLERRIEDAIGRLARDGVRDPAPAPDHRMTGAERDTDSERGSKIPGYSEEHREDGSLNPVARYPLAVLEEDNT